MTNFWVQMYIGIAFGIGFINAVFYIKKYYADHPLTWNSVIGKMKVSFVYGVVFLIAWACSSVFFPLLIVDTIVNAIKKAVAKHHGTMDK